MIIVYIASPYTMGDVAVNVRRQIDAADKLMTLGFVPFAPLYSHFQHMVHPRPYSDWIKIDLEWVKVADCILRLEGESTGADGEVDFATELEKPTFFNYKDLINHYKDQLADTNSFVYLTNDQGRKAILEALNIYQDENN